MNSHQKSSASISGEGVPSTSLILQPGADWFQKHGIETIVTYIGDCCDPFPLRSGEGGEQSLQSNEPQIQSDPIPKTSPSFPCSTSKIPVDIMLDEVNLLDTLLSGAQNVDSAPVQRKTKTTTSSPKKRHVKAPASTIGAVKMPGSTPRVASRSAEKQLPTPESKLASIRLPRVATLPVKKPPPVNESTPRASEYIWKPSQLKLKSGQLPRVATLPTPINRPPTPESLVSLEISSSSSSTALPRVATLSTRSRSFSPDNCNDNRPQSTPARPRGPTVAVSPRLSTADRFGEKIPKRLTTERFTLAQSTELLSSQLRRYGEDEGDESEGAVASAMQSIDHNIAKRHFFS